MPSNGSEDNEEKKWTEKKLNQSTKLACVGNVELDAIFACPKYFFDKTDEYGQIEQFDKEIPDLQKLVKHRESGEWNARKFFVH